MRWARRAAAFACAGALLGLGAPLGLLLLRAALLSRLPDLAWACSQLSQDPPLYLYLSLATTSVMAGIGLLIGRYQDRLLSLSNMDPLTRLSNRRRFAEALEADAARSRRYGRPLAVVLIDVDYFKRVNDQFGHLTGDAVLESVAACLRSASRETDVPARYGGDEFALLLPETTRDRALHVAERLAQAVRALPPYAQSAPPITLSMGIADLGPREGTTALLGRADQALYEAKAAGRDRAAVAPPGQPGAADLAPHVRADP